MGAEFRLVRPDGSPLDISQDELVRFGTLGMEAQFEPLDGSEVRSIRIDVTDGFEQVGRQAAKDLAEALGLVAIDLTEGVALDEESGQVPWWAFWRGR